MGSGLKEDPKDGRFTWEEDENGNDSNAKSRDWHEDLGPRLLKSVVPSRTF